MAVRKLMSVLKRHHNHTQYIQKYELCTGHVYWLSGHISYLFSDWCRVKTNHYLITHENVSNTKCWLFHERQQNQEKKLEILFY